MHVEDTVTRDLSILMKLQLYIHNYTYIYMCTLMIICLHYSIIIIIYN